MQDPHLLENNYSDKHTDEILINNILNDVFMEKERGANSYVHNFNISVSKQTIQFAIDKLRELFPEAIVLAYTIKELNGTVSAESLSIDW
jgi:hypothetical protein